MRRTKRRSTTYRRRRRTRRSSTKAEVKYATYNVQDVPQTIQYSGLSRILYGAQHAISNFLAYIPQGTARNNRVGSKIFLKHITFRIWTRACPGATTYNVASYNLRIILSNTGYDRIAAGGNIANYFALNQRSNINGFIDRSVISVYHDKIYTINSSWATSSVQPDNLAGGSRCIVFTHYFNRPVTYQDDGLLVRNDRDFLSLMMIVGTPGMNSITSGTQVACSDIEARIYFTDA